MDIQESQSEKEKYDFIKAYLQLDLQMQNPSREGMIQALKEALKVSWTDIKTVETARNETVPTPWEEVSYDDLYKKLSEYQSGLLNYAIRKYGKEKTEKWINKRYDYEKSKKRSD